MPIYHLRASPTLASIQHQEEREREGSGTMRVGILDYCIPVQPVGIKSGQYR